MSICGVFPIPPHGHGRPSGKYPRHRCFVCMCYRSPRGGVGVESGGGFWGEKTETGKELIELLQVVEIHVANIHACMHVCVFRRCVWQCCIWFKLYVICNLAAFQCHVEALKKGSFKGTNPSMTWLRRDPSHDLGELEDQRILCRCQSRSWKLKLKNFEEQMQFWDDHLPTHDGFVCVFVFVLFVCLFVWQLFVSFFLSFFLSFDWVCLSEFNLSLLKGIMFNLCCFCSFFVFQCPYILQFCREPTPWGKNKVWLSWWPLIGPHRCGRAMGGWDVCQGNRLGIFSLKPWYFSRFIYTQFLR